MYIESRIEVNLKIGRVCKTDNIGKSFTTISMGQDPSDATRNQNDFGGVRVRRSKAARPGAGRSLSEGYVKI